MFTALWMQRERQVLSDKYSKYPNISPTIHAVLRCSSSSSRHLESVRMPRRTASGTAPGREPHGDNRTASTALGCVCDLACCTQASTRLPSSASYRQRRQARSANCHAYRRPRGAGGGGGLERWRLDVQTAGGQLTRRRWSVGEVGGQGLQVVGDAASRAFVV
mmetsp:Transcript_5329/g.16115  ORF Transcript_5329/g.16115 Transcript_5329/m.16115 type:complete len:163 (-) Transcript_5329:627-1115(-)|eukprot:347647-Chlamydomonas_euryale.AAC.4